MRLTVESMSYGSDAVAHVDGKAVFVAGGVPGDVVEAEIVSDGRSFSKARVVEVLEPSPDRVAPRCPHADRCGGCPWSRMSYEAQARAKERNVRDALARIAKMPADEVDRLVEPIESPGDPWGYRNKVELAVMPQGGGAMLGMHAADNPDELVAVDSCPLLDPAGGKILKNVSGALRFLGRGRDLGLERVGIRVSGRTGQTEVALWTDPAAFPRNEAAKVLRDAAKPSSIARVMVKGDSAARKIAGIETLDGNGWWAERVAGRRMRLSAPSFFQVNTAGAEMLVDIVMDGLAVGRDEVAADLYCGAGTFTLPLASVCDNVLAVESYGPAVRDLRANVEKARFDEYVEIVGDAAERQTECLEDVDVVVVDPPRAGLHRDVVEALGESPARAVAYVSCDPATLARDLAAFAEFGKLFPVSVTPVDLFAQTFHVETVVLLSR